MDRFGRLIKITFMALVCVATAAYGQQKPQLPDNYPNKPVKVLVGNAPGGGSDFTARVIATKLGERWKSSFVVENHAGAGGVIAMDMVAKAPPNGYTLMVVSGGALVTTVMLTKLPFDVRTAFEPVALLTSEPYVMVVNASFPVNSVQELIAYAKSNPGKLNYASAGSGTNIHLGMELFKSLAGVDMLHIPYKGTGPALIDLLGGRVQVTIGSTISTNAHVKSGKMKALAVTSLKRSKLLPHLPTISETLPGFEMVSSYGLIAPAGTPSVIVQALNREINQIISLPDVAEKLAGAELSPRSPAEYKDFVAKELNRWTEVIKKAKIKVDE